MSVKPEGLLGDVTKKANVLHHPVQAKNLNFNPYIYIYIINHIYLIIFHPNPLVILVN